MVSRFGIGWPGPSLTTFSLFTLNHGLAIVSRTPLSMSAQPRQVNLMLANRAQVLTEDGREVALAERDAAMLALLAVDGPQPRARVIDLLWPGDASEASRNRLRQRLFNLRRACGHPLVVGQATLSLSPDVAHDLAGAASVLGALKLSEFPELSDWLQVERQRRSILQRDQICRQLTELEERQDWDTALQLANTLLQLDPLSEDAHRRLMRLHYLRGDPAAARQAFDRCARLLNDEIGTAPSAETLQLLASLQRAMVPAVGLATVRRQVPVSVLRPPRLVGREAEWAWLETCWRTPCIGIVFAEGGMGKSRLFADFAALQCQGERNTLLVGARPGDARLPCATISRLLRVLLQQCPLSLPEGVRGELARLLPELGSATSVPADASQTRFVNALLSTLSLAQQQGLMAVMVDDLHWADEGSVELLGQLCTGTGLHWAFAMRQVELSTGSARWVDELQSRLRAQALELKPLTPMQVAELLASLDLPDVDSNAWVEALHRRTGGNPQYVLECVKVLLSQPEASDLPGMASLPHSGRLIQLRLGKLSALAVKLARCAAVAGPDFSAALAAGVLHTGALDLADAWNELEAAQVLRDGAFAHDLIYEAALASVPAAIAREMHLEIAAWLELAHGEPSRIATHWLDGGNPLRAAPQLLAAATAAEARLRLNEAAGMFERAADILAQAGQSTAAFDAYFNAVEVLSRLGSAERFAHLGPRLEATSSTDTQRAMAGLAMSNIEGHAGRLEVAERLARQALVAATRSGAGEIESDLEYTLGVYCWERRNVADALQHVDRSLALLRSMKPEDCRLDYATTLLQKMSARGTILSAMGRVADATQELEKSWQVGQAYQRAMVLLFSANALTKAHSFKGSLPEAQAWAERAALLCTEGEVHDVTLTDTIDSRANVLVLAGMWGPALEAKETVAQRLEQHPTRVQGYMFATRAAFYFSLGRRDLALKTIRLGLQASGSIEAQALAMNVVLAMVGEPCDSGRLLERVAALDDVILRSGMLVQLAPICDSAQLLPVLSMATSTLRDGGGMGLWLSLEGRAAFHLARAGRAEEAAARAEEAWALQCAGLSPAHLWPDFAADLAMALKATNPARAQQIAHRGLDWLQSAAASLPAMWRDNCLSRSPLRQRLVGCASLIGAG